MASINKRPSMGIKKSRNSFDMSQRQCFTSAPGQCLPVYYDLLNPGDTVKIDSALLTRTQTLSSNPMTRVTEHIDYFFVPYRRIWSNFNQWFSTMPDDVQSTLLQPGNVSFPFPAIALQTLVTSVPKPDASSWTSGDPYPISSTDTDEFGVLKYHNARRLLDLLGYGVSTIDNLRNNPSTFSVNPALLCAYHAINRDFYRLTDRVQPSPSLSNMDNYSINPPGADILSIYYRPWKRDFYTNIEVSPLFGGYNSLTISSPESFLSNANAQLAGPQSLAPSTSQLSFSTAQTASTNNTFIDSFRRSAAIERLAQLQRFNDKYWNVQLSDLFGLEVPDGYEHVMYLGSHHSQLQFSDVVGTATTSDSVLGEVVGKGLAFPESQKPIDFTAKQHGYIMAIYSTVPDSDYLSLGMDRINTYTSRNEFYNPAYDNLGMQPKYAYESNFTGNTSQNATVLGWTYRWQELKNKPDLIHGAFTTSLRHWVTSRSNSTMGINYKNFCIEPSYFDSIMLAAFIPSLSTVGTDAEVQARFTSYINDAFGRDPLFHQLYFKAFKLSSMSQFSLPSHNSVML